MKIYAIEVSDDGIRWDFLNVRYDEITAFQFYRYVSGLQHYKYYRITVFTRSAVLVSDR